MPRVAASAKASSSLLGWLLLLLCRGHALPSGGCLLSLVSGRRLLLLCDCPLVLMVSVVRPATTTIRSS